MGSYVLIGGTVIFGLSLLTNPSKTIELGTIAITTYGAKFLAQRITQTINRDASDIISFSGWCLMGIPIVGILKLSMGGLYTIKGSIDKINMTINSIGQFLDKLTFWN